MRQLTQGGKSCCFNTSPTASSVKNILAVGTVDLRLRYLIYGSNDHL